MAGTDTNSAQELIEAYNQAISSAFTVAGTNMTQATEAAKVVADAAQTERNEYGKTVEEAVGHSRKRGENIAGAMRSFTATPANGEPSFSPEAKESIDKLIQGEMDFYQSFTKSWTDYLTGLEERRSAAAKAMLEGNAKMIESGQEVAKSAAKYGEALMQWSLDNAKATKS